MGIPHLITHLRPYANETDLKGWAVVIDGPGFAYHVFHTCLSDEPNARNPFEAFPSYEKVGETAIRWLEELESCGVQIKEIYFDGFLPLSKKKTRSSRLMNYTKQMATYYEAWPQVIPSMSGKQPAKTTRSSIMAFGTQAAVSSKIPAIPFLVPAIIEKLQSSQKYREITSVLPGEADLYCARYVKEHGGTVLTGDSDLLVHDLGDDGSVAFLRDLDLTASSNVKLLRCLVYSISTIVERLGLRASHGLQALAFEMVMDPHASFPKLLQKARDMKAVSEYAAMYQDFAKEYQALPKEVHTDDGPELSQQQTLQALLRTLDPRISEYVLQFPQTASAAELPLTATDVFDGVLEKPDVFLPFLLDCPSKTSAWEMSTAVRQLAYGLMNLVEPDEAQISSVVEHRRQQKGSKGREWQLPTHREIVEASNALVLLVDRVTGSLLTLPNFDVWRAMAFYQDIEYAYSSGKQSLAGSLFASTSLQHRLSWDVVHFSAQVQGSYYSFRLLKQVLSVVSMCSTPQPLPSILHALKERLQSLPALAELPSLYTDLHSFGAVSERSAFSLVNSLYEKENNITVPAEDAVKSTKKDRKKKRKRDAAAPPSPDAPRKPNNNLFALLDSL